MSGKRPQAVLAMLCLHPGESLERDLLTRLLWPGKFTAHARASLRQTLLGLKKQLAPIEPDFLQIQRDRVSVNPAVLQTDLTDLELALTNPTESSASELLLAIGSQALLDPFELGSAFGQWLSEQREQIDQRLQAAVETALKVCQKQNDQQTAGRLRDAWRLRQSAAALNDAERRIRIAVLPFHVPDAEDEPLAVRQGLFDDLVTALGQLPQLLVAGRTSSLNARKLGNRLPRIASALHVSYLLEGSIQQTDGRLRVHISLVDGHNGFELWGRVLQASSTDILALQDEVANAVTSEISRFFKLEPPMEPARRSDLDPAALQFYLQGRALTMRAIGDGVLARAIELLEKALDLEPEFAAGWTALAEAHAYTAVYTPCLDRVAQSVRMAECASKAIELDPAQGHARALLGIHRWTENDPAGALDLAHEAHRLEPDNPDVTLRLGSFLLYIGRTREALPYIESAIEQDPVNGRNFAMLCVAQMNLGNLEAAIAAGQRMVDLGLPSMWQAVAIAAAGDRELAVEQYWQTRLLMNTVIFPPAGTRPLSGPALNTYWKVAAKGVCSGRKVHRVVYCAMLDYLHASLPDPCDTSIVAPAIWMGYSKMVFKTLGTQVTPANMYCLMSLWADIDPIRQTRIHPEFLPFAERIGLVAAWEKYGWPDLLPASDSGISRS
ncbi:MAG: hypothetical protein ACLFSC_08920 [Wenzhouxiangella sp.]